MGETYDRWAYQARASEWSSLVRGDGPTEALDGQEIADRGEPDDPKSVLLDKGSAAKHSCRECDSGKEVHLQD